MQYTLGKATDFYIENKLKDKEKVEYLTLIDKDPQGPYYANKILRSIKTDPVEKSILFKMVLKNATYSLYLLEDSVMIAQEEKDILIDNIIEQSRIHSIDLIRKDLINLDQLVKIIKTQDLSKGLIDKILKKFHTLSPEDRKYIMDKLMDSPDQLFMLAYNEILLFDEKERVYNKYSKYYFEEFKSSLPSMYVYCNTFIAFISYEEKKTLVDRVRGKMSFELAKAILESKVYYLPEELEDILNSMVLAQELISSGEYEE